MGLTHPVDLAAWQRWQERQHPARALRGRLRPNPPQGILTLGSTDPDLLVVLESGAVSSAAALLAPLTHLDPRRVAVLAPPGTTAALPRHGWREARWTAGDTLGPVRTVLSTGHYLPLGSAVHAQLPDVAFLVAQHGLLTPHQPPLPTGAVLLAWSQADADYWCSDRADVTSLVVGSQLFWAAAREPRVPLHPAAPTIYLGQLHGAELPHRDLARAAEAFCRDNGVTYRPHPGETDRRSRRLHTRWEAAGIDLDRSGRPLGEVGTGVVGVFSTGVLEAAARGLPAWVDFPRPPAWLEEFWQRYSMSPWGGEATPPPTPDPVSPAQRVAELIGAS